VEREQVEREKIAKIIGIALCVLIYLPIILMILSSFYNPFRPRRGCNDCAAVANLRTINTAQVTYLSSSGGSYGTLTDLIDARLLDDLFTGTKAGYKYTITLGASGYTAEAVPALIPKWHAWFSGAAPTKTGSYGYYSVPDAVIRYSTNASLAPAGQSGRSVQ
jgi:hypothetical protein